MPPPGALTAALPMTHDRPTRTAQAGGRRAAERPHRNRIAEVAPDVKSHPIPRDKATTGPGYMCGQTGLFRVHGPEAIRAYGRPRLIQPGRRLDQGRAARSLQTEAVPMHESIDRGRSMARPKRIDDVFDLPARQVQRATTHRSLWAVRLPPTGRRVGRWKRRGDDVDESPDLGRFTDRSGRCPETVHEAAASRRRLGGRERPLPSGALRGLWTAIGPNILATTTLMLNTNKPPRDSVSSFFANSYETNCIEIDATK